LEFFTNVKSNFLQDREWQLVIPTPKFVTALINQAEQNPYSALSPMPGLVDKIFVNKGDAVKKGDSLLVIVAMKMEVSYTIYIIKYFNLFNIILLLQHIIKASTDGTIEDILCSIGENVAKNKLLIKLTEAKT